MLPFDAAVRARVAENLAAFERLGGGDATEGAARHCAVAVCLVAGPDGEACYVLTRRNGRLRAHAGQFALPGGRVDPGEDVTTAARRELAEEVGVTTAPADVLGVLDDYPTRSGDLITPVVVWCPRAAALAPNPDEVAAAHLVPVVELDDPAAPRLLTITDSDRPVIQMPVLGNWIHAPTAAVLYQFREAALPWPPDPRRRLRPAGLGLGPRSTPIPGPHPRDGELPAPRSVPAVIGVSLAAGLEVSGALVRTA